MKTSDLSGFSVMKSRENSVVDGQSSSAAGQASVVMPEPEPIHTQITIEPNHARPDKDFISTIILYNHTNSHHIIEAHMGLHSITPPIDI